MSNESILEIMESYFDVFSFYIILYRRCKILFTIRRHYDYFLNIIIISYYI